MSPGAGPQTHPAPREFLGADPAAPDKVAPESWAPARASPEKSLQKPALAKAQRSAASARASLFAGVSPRPRALGANASGASCRATPWVTEVGPLPGDPCEVAGAAPTLPQRSLQGDAWVLAGVAHCGVAWVAGAATRRAAGGGVTKEPRSGNGVRSRAAPTTWGPGPRLPEDRRLGERRPRPRAHVGGSGASIGRRCRGSPTAGPEV